MNYIKEILTKVFKKNQNQKLFIQSIEEILDGLKTILKFHPELCDSSIIENFIEPEKQFIFKVPWMNDKGVVKVNRGYRIHFNNSLGPFKGGLRFHPTVNLDVIKFLGFEQVLKNSLTGFQIGGGKGGSDFNPKKKSKMEIIRFCQSFMTELYKYIGDRIDIPAGDIGVGLEEIGYLFGQYKRITGTYNSGSLTGKGIAWGGSYVRKEATGFGVIYFLQSMLMHHKLIDISQESNQNSKVNCIVSGSGNVALYAIKKLIEFNFKVVACSDSNGFIYHKSGLNIKTLLKIKEKKHGRVKSYQKFHPDSEYYRNGNIWNVPCSYAFPCATQNEINKKNALKLIKNGCKIIIEGANMPCTSSAVKLFMENKILFAPSKAANSGGVIASYLEMQQNSSMTQWNFKKVDKKLKKAMYRIHKNCILCSKKYKFDSSNYVKSANIVGIIRVLKSIKDHGYL
jgi:glutamate dehydrogenase (NADP+)